MQRFSVIAITGASSGLGAALAAHYAAPGVRLLLTGRDAGRLDAAASFCSAKGARVEQLSCDVRDAATLAGWLRAQDEKQPVDLLIANAGISGGTGGRGIHGETTDQALAIFDINVQGVLHTLSPLLPAMIARGRGQIGIMSSLSALRGLPSAPAYSASKAAVKVYGDALRGLLMGSGVGVSVICPGYIRTPMTEVNRFPMPFLMDAGQAAAIIAHGLEKKKAVIAFPRTLYLSLRLLAMLPEAWTDHFFARLPAKPPLPPALR